MQDTAHTVIRAHNTVNDKATEILDILNELSSREKLFVMALVNQSVNHGLEREVQTKEMCLNIRSINRMMRAVSVSGE